MKIANLVFWLLVVYMSIMSAVQAFKCPKMTDTERLLQIHRSIIWDFKECTYGK
jgi:hypothetical protein